MADLVMAHSSRLTFWPSVRKLLAVSGLVSGVGIGLALSGCTAIETEASGDPRPTVVASTTIIADLTEDIAGDTIQLSSLLEPGDDPQDYEPMSEQASALLDEADLVLYNGLNLMPALETALSSAGDRAPHLPLAELADIETCLLYTSDAADD